MSFWKSLFSDYTDPLSQRVNQERQDEVIDTDYESLMTVDPNKPLPEYSKTLPPVVFENGNN